MKKAIAISSVLLGLVFLTGCGQQIVSQTQPTTPAPVAQQPAQPTTPATISSCEKLTQFKNESWASSLGTLYKNEFAPKQGVNGELWHGEWGSGCKINNLFVFIPEFFEFGCGRILKYDIKNNKLIETVVQSPTACADKFGQITDTYVEYFGGEGDGGQVKNYHGRYYFDSNKIENIK